VERGEPRYPYMRGTTAPLRLTRCGLEGLPETCWRSAGKLGRRSQSAGCSDNCGVSIRRTVAQVAWVPCVKRDVVDLGRQTLMRAPAVRRRRGRRPGRGAPSGNPPSRRSLDRNQVHRQRVEHAHGLARSPHRLAGALEPQHPAGTGSRFPRPAGGRRRNDVRDNESRTAARPGGLTGVLVRCVALSPIGRARSRRLPWPAVPGRRPAHGPSGKQRPSRHR